MTNIFDMLKGNRMYNLEIKTEIQDNNFSEHDLKSINKYLGDFIVTDLGYLIRGFDERLYGKRNAEIKSHDFLSRGIIHFKNGELDQITEDFLGARLLQVKYQKTRERRYQPAGLALA